MSYCFCVLPKEIMFKGLVKNQYIGWIRGMTRGRWTVRRLFSKPVCSKMSLEQGNSGMGGRGEAGQPGDTFWLTSSNHTFRGKGIILSCNPLDSGQIQNADDQLSLLLGGKDECFWAQGKRTRFPKEDLWVLPSHQLSRQVALSCRQHNSTWHADEGLDCRRGRQPHIPAPVHCKPSLRPSPRCNCQK